MARPPQTMLLPGLACFTAVAFELLLQAHKMSIQAFDKNRFVVLYSDKAASPWKQNPPRLSLPLIPSVRAVGGPGA